MPWRRISDETTGALPFEASSGQLACVGCSRPHIATTRSRSVDVPPRGSGGLGIPEPSGGGVRRSNALAAAELHANPSPKSPRRRSYRPQSATSSARHLR
ncbi:MAG: hypothetical protein ABTQ25_05250 [Nitrosomonas ureae]